MKKIIIIPFFLISYIVTATNYYIKNGGSDAASGLSDALAWATIAKVNSFASSPGFAPGDSVLFKCGDSFQTPTAGGGADNSLQLNSGTSGGDIILSSYSTGAKPILHSSVTANSGWSNVSGNIWQNSNAAFIKDVGNVIFNGGTSVGVKKASSAACTAQGNYYSNTGAGTLRMYSVGNPAVFYTDIRCCYQVDVVWLHYLEYITIDGLSISYGGSHGIGGYDCSHIEIRNCDFTWLGGCSLYSDMRYGNGVEFFNDDGYTSDDCLVEYNYFYEIYDTGWSFQGGSDGSPGPHWSNITVRYNVLRNIEWMFEFWTGNNSIVTDVYIQNNTCVDAGGQKLHGQRWGGYTYAVHFYWGPMNGTFTRVYCRNNIFSNANGINNYPPNSSIVAIIIERYADRLKIDVDYNLYRISTDDAGDWPYLGYINSSEREHLSDWQSASGEDAHSYEADPLFVDRANGDFHLSVGSPAIDAGLGVGYNLDYDGNTVGVNPDIGAFEYGSSEPPIPPDLPTVVSSSIQSGWTAIWAITGGDVTDDGGGTVSARGVCWGTSINPTTSDSHSNNGTGEGSFTYTITGLVGNTDYNVRAYATNETGTTYGANIGFTTPKISTLRSRSGKFVMSRDGKRVMVSR